MARITTLDNTGTISMDVAKPSTEGIESAGMVWGSISKVAGGLADVATDLVKKRTQAEAMEYGNQSFINYKTELERKKLELQLSQKEDSSNPDAYYKTYSQDMRTHAETLSKKILSNAPSDVAKEYASRRLDEIQAKEIAEADAQQNFSRAKYFVGNREKIADQRAALAYSSGDFFKANESIKDHEKENALSVGVTLFKESADKNTEDARQKIRQGAIYGSLENGMAGLVTEGMTLDQKQKAFKDLLDGKVKGTEDLFKGMEPTERIKYERMIEGKLKQDYQVQQKTVKEDAKNALLYLKNVESVSMSDSSQIKRALASISMLDNSDPDKGELIKEIQNVQKINTFKSSIKYMSSEQLESMDKDELLKKLKPTMTSIKGDLQDVNLLLTAINQEKSLRNRDGADWAKKANPQARTNPDILINMQRQAGINNPQYMTKDESAKNARMFDLLNTADEKSKFLDQFINQDRYLSDGTERPNWREITNSKLSQMIKQNKASPGLLTAAMIEDPQARSIIMRNEDKEFNKKVSEAYANQFGTDTDLDRKVSSVMATMNRSYYLGNNPEFATGMNSTVTTQAKNYMLKGQSKEKSIQMAIEDIYTGHFNTIEKGKTSLLIPKNSQTESLTPYVNNFAEIGNTKEFIQMMDISPARIRMKWDKNQTDDYISKNSYWVTNSDHQSATLMFETLDGDVLPAKKQSGESIRIKYTEIPELLNKYKTQYGDSPEIRALRRRMESADLMGKALIEKEIQMSMERSKKELEKNITIPMGKK